MATKQDNMTPMMRQFYDLKQKHPDAVLLFRCGDFYESYEDDAKTCAEVLGITLTKRTSSPKGEGYMAGFPHHALDTYLPKIVRAGHRVAICDQLEPPKPTKKNSTPNKQTSSTNNNDTTMKLSINNTTNTETQNTVNNQAIVPAAAVCQPVPPAEAAEPIRDAVAEEIAADAEVKSEGVKSEKSPKKVTLKRKVTIKRKVTLKQKQSEPVSEPQEAPKAALPTVTFSTYKTKRGDTAPQIIGFGGESDPRWKEHKDAGHKYVSASFRRDLNGEKVYILLFGVRYMDVAKALAGAYNTNDRDAWRRAEDACMAIYEQAQRDGKARWEAKKAQWAEKAAQKAAQKAADEQAKKCYSKEDVAAMLADVLAGKDVPEDIKKLLDVA